MTRTPASPVPPSPSPAAKLGQRPGQMSLSDTPEWEDAVSTYLAYERERERRAAA